MTSSTDLKYTATSVHKRQVWTGYQQPLQFTIDLDCHSGVMPGRESASENEGEAEVNVILQTAKQLKLFFFFFFG